jgi:ABC-type nitrate/sulfonate/bicarbonate transport system permease component
VAHLGPQGGSHVIRLLRRLGYALALPVLLLVVWWITTDDSENFYLPPLRTILRAFAETWTLERFQADVLPSLARFAAGYALAGVVGVTVGLLIGGLRWLRALLEPVLEFFRAIPPPVLVPVIMLFAVIAVGAVWPILLNTVEGVRSVDEVLVDTCRAYQLRRFARLRHVILPAASPQIVTGLRQALSIGIILMVISEMFASSNGLGFTIIEFQRSYAIPEMWSGILLLGLIGFLLSVLFRVVENRVLAWYHGLRRAQRSS